VFDGFRFHRTGDTALTFGSLGFLAGVIAALALGGCSGTEPAKPIPVPRSTVVECQPL
jgi:hypothetical protein